MRSSSECVSEARLVLKVCALPGDSRGEMDRGEGQLQAVRTPVGCAGKPPRPIDVGPDGIGRERPSADGRGRCAAPLHTMANEGLLGANVFSQSLTMRPGLYANPVFGMMLQFLNVVRDQKAQVVLVAPGWDGSVPGGGHGGPS
jgi:hypothetical protein